MQEYAGRYEAEFLKDCDGLNALPPTVRPRATEHIDEILSLIHISLFFIKSHPCNY